MLSMVLDKDSDVAVEAVNLLLLIQQWGVSLSLVASLCHCQHTAQEFHFNRSKHPKYARFDWHKCLCFFFLHKKFYSNANKSISISSFIQLVFSLCTLLLCMSCVGLKVKKLLHEILRVKHFPSGKSDAHSAKQFLPQWKQPNITWLANKSFQSPISQQ